MIACSSASFGSALGLRPAACSKSRIAPSVFGTIEAIDRAVVVAAARQLALDVVDDLSGRARAAARQLGRTWDGAAAGSAGRGRGTAAGAPSVATTGLTGTSAFLNIGAGCEPDCMNSTLIRMATVATAADHEADGIPAAQSERAETCAVRVAAECAAFPGPSGIDTH